MSSNYVEAKCPCCHGLLVTNIEKSDSEGSVILECSECHQLYDLVPFMGTYAGDFDE